MTGCAAGTVGAFVGGVVGHSLFGWLGAIGGVPIGAIGGWVIGVGVVAIGFFIGIVTERIDQRQRLRKQFGRYWARNRAKEWEVLVERLTPGQIAFEASGAGHMVCGTVLLLHVLRNRKIC